jgi:hypothetical protein
VTQPHHDDIRQLDEHLWEVTAPTPGSPVPRRMVVIRLTTGALVIHSAVRLRDPDMRRLESLGRPSYLIVPNQFHRIDAPAYKARYPAIAVLCPGPARKRVEKVVAVDGDYSRLPEDPRLRVETLAGSSLQEAVFIYTAASGELTLIFNDTVFNLPDHLPGWKGWVVGLIGSTGGPKVTGLGKLLAVADKHQLADHLRRLAALPELGRIIVAHGDVIDRAASECLKGVADRLCS